VQVNSFFSLRIENLTHLIVELVHLLGFNEVVNPEQFDKFKRRIVEANNFYLHSV